MTQTSFGVLLRRYRTAAGLTQEELAERAGLSPRGISDLERGARRRPHLPTVRMLADALDLVPADQQALLVAGRPNTISETVSTPLPGLSRLPQPLTSLIGREAEIAAVAALLREAEVRLLTLSGPGGTGKTRLALAVAEWVAPAFADGVVFVPLAPLDDPVFVGSAIAQQLGAREAAGQTLIDRLQAHLAGKHLLLVLDNFEHLLPAAPLVVDLLRLCPSLTVLTTSRAPLRLSGERLFPVPPLALPDPTRLPPLADLARIEAVRLFVDRAQAGKSNFAVTETNAAAIGEIVHRLEGLPLALELAAVRVRVLSPAALLVRLDRRLPLLTEGVRDAPQRQRTLRDTIAWSFDLLASDEQRLFRRLAVFAGGCTWDAAETVCGDGGNPDLLSALTTLVDGSLLRQVEGADGEVRYTMFETVREFALEQLAASREEERMRARHAAYFVELARQAETASLGPMERYWSERLQRERGNVGAALRWTAQHGPVDTFLQLATNLVWYWDLWGDYTEGRYWVEHAVEVRDRGGDLGARTTAIFYAAWFLVRFPGQLDRHRALIEEALELAVARNDPFWATRARYQLAINLLLHGQWNEAREVLIPLLAAFRDAGDFPLVVAATYSLAEVSLELGYVDESRDLAAEALTLAQREEFDRGVMWATGSLAMALKRGGDPEGAIARIQEVMALVGRDHNPGSLANYLFDAADIALALNHPREAVTLLFAAKAAYVALGLADDWVDTRADQLREAVIPLIGEDAFTVAVEAGRKMTPDEAVRLVEELARGRETSPGHAGSKTTRGSTTLT